MRDFFETSFLPSASWISKQTNNSKKEKRKKKGNLPSGNLWSLSGETNGYHVGQQLHENKRALSGAHN